MRQVIPEIYVRDCRKALDFYLDVFGGEIKNLQMSDNMEVFSDLHGKVIHSELHVNGSCVLYFADALTENRKEIGNVTPMLHLDNEQETQRIYRALQQQGTVLMELQKTFWGAWHAIVTDRFGAPWALSCADGA